jgi:hypothetical protein
MTMTNPTRGVLAPATVVRVPQNVVFRSFAAETVVLNLATGLYHALNPTGGRMLDTLRRVGHIGTAAEELAEVYGQPVEQIRRDLASFAFDLVERGLLEIERNPGK